MTALLFVGGLVTLTVGAEMLVRGACRIASSFGVSPLVVGLTVVPTDIIPVVAWLGFTVAGAVANRRGWWSRCWRDGLGHSRQVGRLDLRLAVGADVRVAEIIQHDEDDVRLLRGDRGNCGAE